MPLLGEALRLQEGCGQRQHHRPGAKRNEPQTTIWPSAARPILGGHSQ